MRSVETISCPLLPNVTVAVTRHDEPDEMLIACLDRLAAQQDITATILVFDQNPSTRMRQHTMNFQGKRGIQFTYVEIHPCGISKARNLAVQYCQTDILLFTDPDIRVDNLWASHLYQTLTNGAAIAGGRILPDWEKHPMFITRSSLIRDQYSLYDLGVVVVPCGKVIGCNFGINMTRLGAEIAQFDENYGRRYGTLLGGEEVELCERARAAGKKIVYDGQALTLHRIDSTRQSYRWLIRRLYAAGKSRANRGGKPNPTNSLTLDWSTLVAIPLFAFYILGYLLATAQYILSLSRTSRA
ncbi:glycosyltransferase [Gammaproteobacteria bacterium]|nr:glycosyltransferase [Gammaproteobacteria bacterium]